MSDGPSLGGRVRIYWPSEKRWFRGEVKLRRMKRGCAEHRVDYDDGDSRWHKGCGCWVEQNRGTRPTSPQTVPRLATMTGTHPAPSAVSPSLSGVKSPTRSSVTASSNLRRARRTSTAPSVACSSLRLKPGEQLLCCSHALHRWHSLLCGCHSCDSDGLALTGPQSLVLRLV